MDPNCAGRCQHVSKTCRYYESSCFCRSGYVKAPNSDECITTELCEGSIPAVCRIFANFLELQGPDYFFKVQQILNPNRGYQIPCDYLEVGSNDRFVRRRMSPRHTKWRYFHALRTSGQKWTEETATARYELSHGSGVPET